MTGVGEVGVADGVSLCLRYMYMIERGECQACVLQKEGSLDEVRIEDSA